MRKTTLTCLTMLLTLCLLAAHAAAAKGGKGKPPPPPPPPADPQIAVGGSTLSVMNADGSNVTTILDGGGAGISKPAWSPDGTRLAFHSTMQGSGIYVVNLDGTGLTKIASVSWILSEVAWSPGPVPGLGGNQERIAYLDESTPGWNDVYLINPDGTDKVQLTDTPAVYEVQPSWSPSGAKLVVDGWVDPPQVGGLRVCDLTTGACDPITLDGALTGAWAAWPSWSQTDESRIAVVAGPAGGDPGIWILDLDDASAHHEVLSQAGREFRAPSLSPDDSQVAFASAKSGNGPRLTQHKLEVANVADGSGRAVIMEGWAGFAWRR